MFNVVWSFWTDLSTHSSASTLFGSDSVTHFVSPILTSSHSTHTSLFLFNLSVFTQHSHTQLHQQLTVQTYLLFLRINYGSPFHRCLPCYRFFPFLCGIFLRWQPIFREVAHIHFVYISTRRHIELARQVEERKREMLKKTTIVSTVLQWARDDEELCVW